MAPRVVPDNDVLVARGRLPEVVWTVGILGGVAGLFLAEWNIVKVTAAGDRATVRLRRGQRPGIQAAVQSSLSSDDLDAMNGLGLSLVQQLVEGYGGDFVIQDATSEGTTVEFTLKRAGYATDGSFQRTGD